MYPDIARRLKAVTSMQHHVLAATLPEYVFSTMFAVLHKRVISHLSKHASAVRTQRPRVHNWNGEMIDYSGCN